MIPVRYGKRNEGSNVKVRILSGAVFGIVFLSALGAGGWIFLGFSMCLCYISLYEWRRICLQFPPKHRVLAGILGGVFLFVAFWMLYDIREKEGFQHALFLISIVWITDSFAYFTGKLFGKHKLAPAVSPNKTWEGSIGGVFFALLLLLPFSPLLNGGLSYLYSCSLIILLSIAGQLGDLAESFLKRKARLKDSGRILPGHGGVLDRFDSLLLVIVISYVLTL